MPFEFAKGEVENSGVYVRFVDILFAVVLGQSFVLLTPKYGMWFSDWASYIAPIATTLLVYGLVITSWVGYHRSVKAYPILEPYRFILDISLLFIYYAGIASVEDFRLEALLFICVFVVYALWDLTRLGEYWRRLAASRDERKDLIRRAMVSAGFATAFGVLWYVYSFAFPQAFTAGALFVGMLILLVVYRYTKWEYKTKAIA